VPRPTAATAALAVVVAGTAAHLLTADEPSLAVRISSMAVALLGLGALVALARRGHAPSRRAVVVASVALAGLAVVVPPLHSRDVYLYGMQGRILAEHGSNPYLHEPRDFPDDPLLDDVSPPWREGSSYYGPAFTVVEAGIAQVAGPSPLAIRLLFQLLAAAAVLGSLALLWRAGVEAGGLALVGLNPVVVAKGVNEGHVDVLLGLLLLAAVLAARRRPIVAAVLLGLAALVKPFALVAVLALAAWLLVRRGWRTALGAAATSGALVAVGYLLAGGPRAVAPLREAGLHQSRSSIWAQPRVLLTELWVDQGRAGTAAGRDARQLVALLAAATVAVAVVAAIAVVLRRRDSRTAPDPGLVVAAAFAAYLLASVYVPAWYAAGLLPVVAVCWRSRLAALVAAQGGVLAIVYLYSPALTDDPLAPLVRGVATWVVPVAQAAVVAAIVGRAAVEAVRGPRSGPVIRSDIGSGVGSGVGSTTRPTGVASTG